jgi:SOS response regulatory protein OraA/RecX
MYPSFRGRKLNQPNFSKDSIEEIIDRKQKKGGI